MNKNKVTFIAKTNLNNDGRILNELKILKQKLSDYIWIDFILMPDKPLTISVGEVDQFHMVNTAIRSNAIFRFLTVLEFTVKAFFKLVKIKPDLIHAQDTAITLPVYLYKLLRGKKVKVLYDDHEIPNRNEPFQVKVLQYFESLLMRIADFVLFANKERMNYLEDTGKRFQKGDYFLNLPYFPNFDNTSNKIIVGLQELIQEKRRENFRLIMHQGSLEEERGRVKLANFSKILPQNIKILIVGVSKEHFDEFIKQYDLNRACFYFIGFVPYYELSQYWKVVDASIVMYLPTYLNNRFCAPNRLYISYSLALPIIVNINNPVLSNFVKDHSCGLFVEDITEVNVDDIFLINYEAKEISSLITEEMERFLSIYNSLLAV